MRSKYNDDRMVSDTVSLQESRAMTTSGAIRGPRGQILGLIVGATILIAACGGRSKPTAVNTPTPSSSPAGYLIQAQSNLSVGTSRFVFGIADPNNALITTGQPQVFVAQDQHSQVIGPFQASWQAWSPSQGDTFGKPPIPGFFAAQVTVPAAGNWLIGIRDTVAGREIDASATIPVVTQQVAAVGSRALSEATPVATTEADAAKIDTRQPPTPMHYISLDAALRNGKPTVLVFATPQFCQTRLCGPVVDEVLTVYSGVGAARANFVDVEIYPTHDTNNPAPEFLRWGFQTEPWVLVIDRDGIIRARFEGPSVAGEVQGALSPLLSPA